MTVAAFGGYAVERAEFDALAAEVQTHAIQVDDDVFMTSVPPFSPADCVNHSCDPNCGILGSIVLVTMRAVTAGEELCFDYAMSDTDPYDEFTCACAIADCRRTITGKDWRLPELQIRYNGYFSAYIARKIAAFGD
ncbi:MAG: SET domain-containing protein-lysine N-methyltransferase [Actinomycetota bacterium]|nr:SET domain-containing protein-lysine N-methyltransferase [Actinomycetota bacterium]